MNKEKRSPYRFLANLPREGWGLCNVCHFAEWNGYYCCDCELHCTHPLAAVNGEDDDGEHVNDVWGGGADCWGFRPKYTLQEVGICASIRFAGRLPVKRNGEWMAMALSLSEREVLMP